MKKALVLLLLALMIMPAVALAQGGGPVVALGRAPVAGNEPTARDQAVQDALRQAVGQCVAKLLDPASLRAGLANLDKKILAKASQYVASFTMEASSVDGGFILVLVSANVDQDALDKALAQAGLRVPTEHLGRFLALISEENAPGRPPAFWWSGYGQEDGAPALVTKVLRTMNVGLLDVAALRQTLPPELKQAALNDDQALQLARLAGSDILLRGRVRTYPLVSQPGQPVTPLVDVRALEVATGRSLAQVQAQGPVFAQVPGVEGAEQVDAAVEEAMRNLMAQIAASRPARAEDQGNLEIELSGATSLGQLLKFEQVATSLSTLVKSLQRQSVGGGKVIYKAEIRGNSSRLADELLVQNYGGFLVNVLEVEPGRIKLAVLPNR